MIKLFNKNKNKLSILSIGIIAILGVVLLTNGSKAATVEKLNNEKVEVVDFISHDNKGKKISMYTIDQLTQGVLENDIDLVEKIIKEGIIDVNTKDTEGIYPIEQVLVMANCDMSKILLKAGADPYVKTSDDTSVYDKVIEGDNKYLKSIFKEYRK